MHGLDNLQNLLSVGAIRRFIFSFFANQNFSQDRKTEQLRKWITRKAAHNRYHLIILDITCRLKKQHFKDLKGTMNKVTESITALEIKMMNNHKALVNKTETVEKKTDEALQLAKKHEAEINEISNLQVQIKKELT